MRILADTNVLLWWLAADARLRPYETALRDPHNEVYFSSISVAEISIKSTLGKLTVPTNYVEQLQKDQFDELSFTATHAAALADLPWHHRDPFDRMLLAQALVENLTIATADRGFTPYGVHLI
jgi:PIN domain nuclease of toxin-antitoxin system